MRIPLSPEEFASLKNAHFRVLAARLDFMAAREALATQETAFTTRLTQLGEAHPAMRDHDRFEYDDDAHTIVTL